MRPKLLAVYKLHKDWGCFPMLSNNKKKEGTLLFLAFINIGEKVHVTKYRRGNILPFLLATPSPKSSSVLHTYAHHHQKLASESFSTSHLGIWNHAAVRQSRFLAKNMEAKKNVYAKRV